MSPFEYELNTLNTDLAQELTHPDPRVLSILKDSEFIVCCDDSYNAFPDLALTKDRKRLICAWRAADHHVPAEYSRIMLSFSDDFGRSWSLPEILAENGLDAANHFRYWDCPAMSVLDDGRIVMLINRCEQGDINGAERTMPPSVVMFISNDNGQTWGESVDLPANGICPDRLLVTSDGGWIISAHWYNTKFKPKKLVQQAWRSDDEGQTWQGPYIVGLDPEYHLCEASIIEPKPGTLVAYMRENSSLGYPIFKSISIDGGKTWELTETNLLGGHRPKAAMLSDGNVLITYRFFEGGRPLGHTNVFAYIESADSSCELNRLGQQGRIIPIITDCHSHPDTGYTGWVQIEEGSVILVNYIRGSRNKAYIHGFQLSKELCKL